MKPLRHENTILEFLRAYIFMIFGTCFTVNSKIYILSFLYQILLFLGLHFGTLGTTFEGLFFRSRKTPGSFLHCAPGAEASSIPPGEGGNWEASGRHLGGIHRRFSPLTLPTSKKHSMTFVPQLKLAKRSFFMTFGLHFCTFFS